ncbi:MAG: GNAT family N-acetyltransferase [Chloroflexi bacterium]|nr:GNAT family N-acetyltransferase [Chloroflexota bacterium]
MEAVDFVTIRREHPATEAASRLISELDAYLSPLYPQESQHGYNIEKLVERQVEFFVLYCDGEPAACGGVQFFAGPQEKGGAYGELKRMYVRDRFRGRGFGKRLLEHLERLAMDRDVTTMRLETGTRQPEAVGLYEKAGYYRIPPFGDYWDDPVSLCYEKRLGDQHHG